MTTDHERDTQAKLSQYKGELQASKAAELAYRKDHAEDSRAGLMGSRKAFYAALEAFKDDQTRLRKLVRYYSS